MMKEQICLLVCVVILISPQVFPQDNEAGFVSIFDGKTLKDWDGLGGWWWVEDGAITSESTNEKPCKNAHYLFWTKEQPEDFILKLEFRLRNGNSGIQFRSERRPNYDIWGYQADIDDTGEWIGALFQHDRWAVAKRGYRVWIDQNGNKKEETISTPNELVKHIKQNDWNEYEIRAIGNHIQLYINGKLMCEAFDDDAKFSRRKGYIALQMHPGPPMKIQFRNIRIKILK
ncbi:MAG: DUF1080 domain-containing protein [Candidatus Hydrogenedentes bacterium]|nr:DUF1080 domain-containing protein [Candidatus Hydrogenedentota bacterium]